MNLTIISPRARIYPTVTERVFEEKACPGAGYSFPCDKDGKLEKLNAGAQASFDMLMADQALPASERKYVDKGIRTMDLQPYSEPAIGRCSCGEQVALENPLTNDCVCGNAYNMSGQQVQSPSDHHYDDVIEECYADVLVGIAGETDDITLGADLRYV